MVAKAISKHFEKIRIFIRPQFESQVIPLGMTRKYIALIWWKRHWLRAFMPNLVAVHDAAETVRLLKSG